jgi:Trypsin
MTERSGVAPCALGRLWSMLGLALLLTTSACDGAERLGQVDAAVFGGSPAPDDTAVLAVVNFSGGQCSGSLIAPNLVLTARHCVADTAGKELQVVCGQTMFQPPDSAGAIFVLAQPQITENTPDYLAVDAVRMPEGSSADLCGTDVALLRLKAPLSDITPLVPRVEEPVTPPEAYSSVGFGLDESLADKPSGERKRLDGLKVLCLGGKCRDETVRDNEWVGSGGPCQGDSGGPALDVNGQIVGVVSRGASGCKQPVFSDVASRSDWLKSEAVLAANAARQPPPSWAPCSDATPCDDLTPEEDGPADNGCTLTRAPSAGGSSWLLLAAVFGAFLGRARKNLSKRR